MGSTRRFRNSVGPLIRKRRIELDWSQEQLAAKLQLMGLSLDRASVAKIEARIRSVFDFELAIIARVLNVSADDLLPSERELRRLLPMLLEGETTKPGR